MRMTTLFAAGALTIAAFVAAPAAQTLNANAQTSVPQVSVHDCQYHWHGRRWRYRWRGRYFNTRFRCRRVRGGWCYR